MGLPNSGEDTSGDMSAPPDAPPDRTVRHFATVRGREILQFKSPFIVIQAAGTVKARRSDRGREEPLPPRLLLIAGRQPARSIGLAI